MPEDPVHRLYTLPFHHSALDVQAVAYSPDGGRLASSGGDGGVRLWDAATGRLLAYPGAGGPIVDCLAFSPNGKFIATGAKDGTIAIWDIREKYLTLRFPAHKRVFVVPMSPLDNIKCVTAIAWSPDGSRIASGGGDKKVRIWNASSGKMVREIGGYYGNGISAVSYSPAGDYLVSASWDSSVRVCDLATGKKVWRRDCDSSVMSALFSPDGKIVATASDVGTTDLWDAKTGRKLRSMGVDKFSVRSLSFSPNARMLASGGENQAVIVWDTAKGKVRWRTKRLSTWATSVCFSPDGRTVACGDYQGAVHIWDARTGQEREFPAGHRLDSAGRERAR